MAESMLFRGPLAGLGICAAIMGYTLGCEPDEPTPDTVMLASTDGRFRVEASIHIDPQNSTRHGCVKFDITDQDGRLVLHQQTHAPFSDPWEIKWDDSNRLWLSSQSIGVFHWTLQTNGKWHTQRYRRSLSPPCPFSTCD